nr:uncharacterized protein LOC108126193 [Drosophila bipectinata]
MFKCSHCNRRRSKLSLRHGDIQSLRKDYVSGATSWCSSCKKLRFFMKRKTGSDSDEADCHSLPWVDSIDSVPVQQGKGKLRALFNSRSRAQNQQAARLAFHLNNWAVQAVDPPSRGQSFTRFPALRPIKDRVREELHDESVPPPITPLNLFKRPKSVERLRKVETPRTQLKRKPSPPKEPKVELRGIERLRATAPPHLATAGLERTSLPPRSNQHNDAAKTLTNISASKDRWQPTIAATNLSINGELPGTSKAHSHRSQTEPPTSSLPRVISNRTLQRKRRQKSQLDRMRSRFEEPTRKEVQHLEHQTPRMSRHSREKGGAHLPQTLVPPIAASGLFENNYWDASLNILLKSHTAWPQSLGSLESSTDIDSYPSTEEKDTGKVYLKELYTNPYFKPHKVYGVPVLKGSEQLEVPKEVCLVACSAQRASLQATTSERLKTKLIEWERTGIPHILERPKNYFSSVACTENELLTTSTDLLEENDKRLELKISHSPLVCPDSNCRRAAFKNDYNKHLSMEHLTLSMERIGIRQTKTFILDFKMVHLNKPKCHMVYLVQDRIIATHGDGVKDLLPVLVMTARANLAEAMGSTNGNTARCIKAGRDTEMFFIWLTSIIPCDMPLMATLCLWATKGTKIVDCLSVSTSHVYDIQASQDMGSICKSPSTLMIPIHMISRMTAKGTNFLVVQVTVY